MWVAASATKQSNEDGDGFTIAAAPATDPGAALAAFYIATLDLSKVSAK
jgi:hypothetical protein